MSRSSSRQPHSGARSGGGSLQISMDEILNPGHSATSGTITSDSRRVFRQTEQVTDTRPTKRPRVEPATLGDVFDVTWNTSFTTNANPTNKGPSVGSKATTPRNANSVRDSLYSCVKLMNLLRMTQWPHGGMLLKTGDKRCWKSYTA